MATNIPESLKLIFADAIKQDYFSHAKHTARLEVFYKDLNRSSSSISYLHKNINLQDLMLDTIEEINSEHGEKLLDLTNFNHNSIFRARFIYNLQQKTKINNPHFIERFLKLLSQEVTLGHHCIVNQLLLSNPDLNLNDIENLDIIKYLKNPPPSMKREDSHHHITIKPDGTINVKSQFYLSKITSLDGEEYCSEDKEADTSIFEYTINPRTGKVVVDKLTIPSLVEQYREKQRLLDLLETSSNISSKGSNITTDLDTKPKAKTNSFNLVNHFSNIYNTLKVITFGFIASIIKTVFDLFKSKKSEPIIIIPNNPIIIEAQRPSAIGYDFNYLKLQKSQKDSEKKQAARTTTQAQQPVPCHPRRAP